MKKRKIKSLFHLAIGRSLGGNLTVFLMLALIAAFMALPLIYVISNAFKPLDELFMFPPRFFVRNPTLENFSNLSALMNTSTVPIGRYLTNTIFLTVTTTVAHVLVASLAAYILEKRDFPGKEILFSMVVTSLMFSGTVTAIPNYLILSKLGMIDTYWAIIIPGIGSSLGLYLMKQFMGGVPNTLLESAKLDGAGELFIFFKIAMPLVKPAWLTLIILEFQAMWAFTGSNVIFSEELKPFNYAISQIMSGGIARAGASAAVSLLMLIVPLSVFIVTQSNVLETMASSGIKE